MLDYYKDQFQSVAGEFGGTYQVQEEIVKGRDMSSLPVSYHKLVIPNAQNEIVVNFEFAETSMGTIRTKVKGWNKSLFFKVKKRSHLNLLIGSNKRSLFVESERSRVKQQIEKYLEETGLESIAKETLFELEIKFEIMGSNTVVEAVFNMAFENKENVVKPLILFFKRISQYLNSFE